VTERPILFSGPLVRAILADLKTETRRLVTPGTSVVSYPWDQLDWNAHVCESTNRSDHGEPCTGRCLGRDYHCAFVDGHPSEPCGFGHGEYIHVPGKEETRQRVFCRTTPGDVLRVRESWRTCATLDHVKPSELPEDAPILYAADKHARGETGEWGKGRPSIFLPKWASRIRLRVTDVKAERLQWITDDDALAEGIEMVMESFAAGGHYRSEVALRWDRINGQRPGASWAANPWVWVLKFERVR
jgi:hypothetical protein